MKGEGGKGGCSEAGGTLFKTTHWSVVLSAGRPDFPEATTALEELCCSYWYPIYVYVRRRGNSHEDACDLTQEFFARLLSRNYLSAAGPGKGKFRWFLLCAVKRFLLNEQVRASAKKCGGGIVHIPLDGQATAGRYQLAATDQIAPDKLFDQAWAVTLIEAADRRLQQECEQEGKAERFKHLRIFLSGDKTGVTYAQIGARLGMTEGAVKVAVHRLRRRYRELLREQVAQTTRTEAEMEEELCYLLEVFSV